MGSHCRARHTPTGRERAHVSRTAFSRLSSAFRGSGRIDQAESPAVVDRYTGAVLTPHEVQEEILRSTARITLCIAGNQVGKSTGALCWEVAQRAWGKHEWKPVRLASTIWVCFEDFDWFDRVMLPMWERFFPRSLVPRGTRVPGRQNKIISLNRVDGGKCDLNLLSYQQDTQSAAGAGIDFFLADEVPPYAFYKEAIARLFTRNGQALITATPVLGLGELEEELLIPWRAGAAPDVHVIEGGQAEYSEALEKAEPESLGVVRSKLPWKTREEVIAFARLYKDRSERMIRVFGIYHKRTGGIYGAWDPEVHVVPAFDPPEHWELFGGCDPGLNGFAAVAEALSPEGRRYVAMEYFNQGGTHDQHIEGIWQKVRQNLPRYREYVPESEQAGYLERRWEQLVRKVPPLVFFTDTAAAQDILELNAAALRCEWTDHLGNAHTGVPVVFAAIPQVGKAVRAGVKRIQTLIEPLPKRATPFEVTRDRKDEGEPLLYVFDNLVSEWTYRAPGKRAEDEGEHMTGCRLAWEFPRYRWAKPAPNQSEPSEPDKHSAGGGHALAALRYSEMARYLPPQEPEKDRYEGMSERERRLAEALERAEREA